MKIFSLIMLFSALNAFAGPSDMQPNDPGSQGNERSERVSNIQVSDPVYAGNACPNGSLHISWAPDFLSFSVIYDRFVAQIANAHLDANGNRIFDRVICNAAVQIQIPDGMQMSITRVDYRGFTDLPQGATALLNAQVAFTQGFRPIPNAQTLDLRYYFQGPKSEDYFLSSGIVPGLPVAQTAYSSSCGGPNRLNINNNLRVMTNGPGVLAQATLDSVDGTGNAVFFVNWQRCAAANPGNPGHGPRPFFRR